MPRQYWILTASHQQRASQDFDVPNEPAAKVCRLMEAFQDQHLAWVYAGLELEQGAGLKRCQDRTEF